MHYLTEIALWLFVLNLGVAFGAGLYETRIVLPMWFSHLRGIGYKVNTEAMAQTDPGRKFWGMVTTAPLTLLTIANLILAWQSFEPRHIWWLAAAVITLLERLGTFSFFIPIAIKLSKANQLDPTKVSSLAALWIRMNYIRNALTLIAWILAIRALMLA